MVVVRRSSTAHDRSFPVGHQHSHRPEQSSSVQYQSVSIRDASMSSPGQPSKRDLQDSCSAPKTPQHFVPTSQGVDVFGDTGSLPNVRMRSIRPTCETDNIAIYVQRMWLFPAYENNRNNNKTAYRSDVRIPRSFAPGIEPGRLVMAMDAIQRAGTARRRKRGVLEGRMDPDLRYLLFRS